ncbi:OB-fold nucleic acid binding domain-containing protein [Acuticoccus sediminis]|uniref:OB-fold nucleic acid binding domain-containing protein n=1 Tax=Acuticoccus sediminis TaxID=2184697 RepID=UPI001CFCAC66|nr:OB-fold nucleic acid binding domain-containing protein [Acuticoccus sediminis]
MLSRQRTRGIVLWLASVALFILAGTASAARAQTADPCFGPAEPVTIAGPAGPMTLALDDGRLVRLADIAAAGPAADRRLEAMAGQAAGLRRVAAFEGADRHGRIVGDVVPKDTTEGLRIELLSGGLALVDPAVISEECLETSFAAERRAEGAAKGVWSQHHPVLSANASNRLERVGQNVLVEGTVMDVGRSRRTIFLNFGADWRSDFTAMVAQRTAGKWVDAPVTLTGARVRIRGVLEAWNGGLIKVEHPAQIERLDASSRPRLRSDSR